MEHPDIQNPSFPHHPAGSESFRLPLLVIAGPTASGKSTLAIKLAPALDGEVINCDSAQIYQELSIITARTEPDEMEEIPHHLTGHCQLWDKYSAARYQQEAYQIIMDIHRRGHLPILCGGTFLYMKAVMEGYDLREIPCDPEKTRQFHDRTQKLSNQALYLELEISDPVAASRIHPNNRRRVLRALEVIESTGEKFSDRHRKNPFHPLGISPILVVIVPDRDTLYRRIENRTDKMFESGAIEEIRHLVNTGRREALEDAQILGAGEILSFLDGFCTLEEGITLVKRNTRRYAKRQFTWIRSLNPQIVLGHVCSGNINQTQYHRIVSTIKELLPASGNRNK